MNFKKEKLLFFLFLVISILLHCIFLIFIQKISNYKNKKHLNIKNKSKQLIYFKEPKILNKQLEAKREIEKNKIENTKNLQILNLIKNSISQNTTENKTKTTKKAAKKITLNKKLENNKKLQKKRSNNLQSIKTSKNTFIKNITSTNNLNESAAITKTENKDFKLKELQNSFKNYLNGLSSNFTYKNQNTVQADLKNLTFTKYNESIAATLKTAINSLNQLKINTNKEASSTILITLDINGNITATKLIESSKITELDNYLIKIIKECGSFPAIPKNLNIANYSFPFKYSLNPSQKFFNQKNVLYI